MPSPITDPGYRYATEKYPGDGVTVDFEFNFAGGYLDKTHVRVFTRDQYYVDTEIPYSQLVFTGPNQIKIPTPVPSNETLIIRRDTPKDMPVLDYVDGAILNEKNLNTTTDQSVFASAEMVDLFADLLDAFHGVDQNVVDSLGYAQNALSVANQAVTYANQAIASAQSANDKSDTAIATANSALSTAQAAVSTANAAVATANAAAASAAAAESSAADALTQASNAATSAANAQDAASAAAASAADAENTVTLIYNAAKKMEIATYTGLDLKYNNMEVIRYVTARSWTTQQSLSNAVLHLAPTNDFTMSVLKNGTVIASISWLAGELIGVLNFPTDGIAFATGDILSISTIDGDATASGLSLTIAGIRS